MPVARRYRKLSDTQNELEQWHQDENPMVYSLGKRATLLAEAHFLEQAAPEVGAFYEFVVTVDNRNVDSGLAKALFRAVHYDFERRSRYEGATWSETSAHNPSKLAYEEVGYSEVEKGNDTTLWVRRPSHES